MFIFVCLGLQIYLFVYLGNVKGQKFITAEQTEDQIWIRELGKANFVCPTPFYSGEGWGFTINGLFKMI